MRPAPWNWLSQDVRVFSELKYTSPAASVDAKRWDAAQMAGPYNINLAAFAASLDQVVAWGAEQVLAHGHQLIERLFSGCPPRASGPVRVLPLSAVLSGALRQQTTPGPTTSMRRFGASGSSSAVGAARSAWHLTS